MNFLYNIFVYLGSLVLKLVAVFNRKIELFVSGRKETFDSLSVLKKDDKVVWIHAASLGEFEQARPIIEKIKTQYATYKIVVTFFSPSGYEIRKNYNLADVVCYLPLDSISNAKKFIDIVHPSLAIFVKYEFWPNLLHELQRNEISTILISGILREKQVFFKWYGSFMRNALKAFDHFFVQNTVSEKLLKSIHYNNVTVAGDTRFDRVYEILQQDNSLDFIHEFKNNQYTVVAGSTWKEDEELLVHYINNEASAAEKFIIAPHNINQKEIDNLRKSILKKTVLYSNRKEVTLEDCQVFIVDTIGILTKIYSVADVAYVGGGLKTGLHNILEPATFGIPVVIGNQFEKFKEAVDLVELKGCISIQNQDQFSSIFTRLKSDENYRKLTGEISRTYIQEHLGATKKIMNYLKLKL
jgi:3-deoxy-D-manno-octulosonic-acid transferase